MPVAVANPLISSPYGAGRVSARGPYRKKISAAIPLVLHYGFK